MQRNPAHQPGPALGCSFHVPPTSCCSPERTLMMPEAVACYAIHSSSQPAKQEQYPVKICIAGAGIGGCVAALSLAELGHEVDVYESVPALSPLGVGINLLPHAIQVLERLGMSSRLEALGVATRELVYFNKHGQRIWGEPRGRFAGYPVPQVSIHRGVLQMELFAAARKQLGDECIHTGHRFASVTEGEPVTAIFDTPAGSRVSVEADML